MWDADVENPVSGPAAFGKILRDPILRNGLDPLNGSAYDTAITQWSPEVLGFQFQFGG
jgi:hypothetical protein